MSADTTTSEKRRTAPRRRLGVSIKLAMLRAVEAIARRGTLVKAAAELGVSQPALTRTLREAERLVGAPLFERGPRGVRPTEAGLRFARSARRVAAEIDRLDTELEAVASARLGLVSVGALPVAAVGIMPRLLTTLRRDHPSLNVTVRQDTTDGLLPLLAAGELDMVVGRLYPPPQPDGFERRRLWIEPVSMFARAGHPVLRSGEPAAGMLKRYGLVLPATSQRVSDDIEQFLAPLGLTGQGALRVNSHALIREVMHDSDMLTVMPRLMMAGDLQRGTVEIVPLPTAQFRRESGIILASGSMLSDAARIVVDALAGELDRLGAEGLVALTQPADQT